MFKSPLIVQPEGSVTPDGCVFVINIVVTVCGVPTMVNNPLPLNSIIPVLVNVVPLKVIVVADEGENLIVPALVTVPLLVKVLLNICVAEPPLNVVPFDTVNTPFTVHPTPGEIPDADVLLILSVVNCGELAPLNVGATVPLKLTVPVLLNPEFNARF